MNLPLPADWETLTYAAFPEAIQNFSTEANQAIHTRKRKKWLGFSQGIRNAEMGFNHRRIQGG